MRFLPGAALALSLSVGLASAQTATPQASGEDVAKAVKSLVERDFYKRIQFPSLTGNVTDADIDAALSALGTSHTARFKPQTLDYFELTDILRYPIRQDLKRLFPPDGEPRYDGIGIVTRDLNGRTFVSDIYQGTPAASSDLMVGDEVVSVDGKPFDAIESFRHKAGRPTKLTIRRAANAEPMDVTVQPVRISPTRTFAKAIEKSMQVVEQDGMKIGYFRLWALGSIEIEEMLTQALKLGALKEADGLVVDLRGRWGGMFAQVPDLLISESPDVSFINRKGETSFASASFDKPVVAIVDEGSRSSQEMFAALMRKRGAEIVGKRTAGAVLAAGAYILPDNSLLVLPISEVRINGELLEGKGVTPDKEVDFWLPYAAGKDPQHDAAFDALAQKLCTTWQHSYRPQCKALAN